MARTHYCPTDRVHYTWDAGNPPLLNVASGDTVVFHTREVSDGQITPTSGPEAIGSINWDRVYPLAGPVFVEGARPGDTLEVEIRDIRTQGWGWTGIIPGFGLLAEEFKEPYVKIFDLTAGDVTYFRDDIAIPIEPFFGTMGVCPAGAKAQSVMPPGRFGGNMDTRQLTRGTRLFLPVQEPGALFSCGDAHAAQGDGEVCVTGIECPVYAALRFTLHKGRSIAGPQFQTAGALTPRVDGKGFYGTCGVSGDLMDASRQALRAMVEHVSQTYRLPAVDAYALASLSVDLKISEIVDAGQFIVSALLPLAIFRE